MSNFSKIPIKVSCISHIIYQTIPRTLFDTLKFPAPSDRDSKPSDDPFCGNIVQASWRNPSLLHGEAVLTEWEQCKPRTWAAHIWTNTKTTCILCATRLCYFTLCSLGGHYSSKDWQGSTLALHIKEDGNCEVCNHTPRYVAMVVRVMEVHCAYTKFLRCSKV